MLYLPYIFDIHLSGAGEFGSYKFIEVKIYLNGGVD